MMPTTAPIDWHTHANALLKSLVARHSDPYGLGSVGPSTYDTAWVSLISRQVGRQRQWVFPHSFQYIYDTQASDGGWRGDGSTVDAILNTLACLLSLIRHRDTWRDDATDITTRIEKAAVFLNHRLQEWDLSSTERIAFEIIIPSLLEMLEKEGIHFDFPQRYILQKLNEKKLAKFDVDILYKSHSIVLHSLEAFIGKVDFDRLAKHTRQGNFMSSPSSTAAYLMSISTWDEEAEQYLHHVIQQCKPYGYGSVCTVWPTTVFEFSWTICNLFQSGFDTEKLDKPSLHHISDILHKALVKGKGISGWTPDVVPDADDSAKSITALHFLGVQFSLDALLKTFELPTHFLCFHNERNPSFSAHCNVLLALLHSSEPQKYAVQVEKAGSFMANEWWTTEGMLTDKWHLSPWYPIMLASQGLLRLLYLHGKAPFSEISEHLLKVKIPIMLFQMLLRILQRQRQDGSWGVNGSREETAYAILALANLASLPYVELIREQIEASVSRGREYLLAGWKDGRLHLGPEDSIWIGKVGYGLEHICTSYIVSAMHISLPLYDVGAVSSGAPLISTKSVEEFTRFYRRLPKFKEYETWRLKAWLIEGYLYLTELSRVRGDVFDRAGVKEDPYFEYLPFSWTCPNGIAATPASTQTILDLIILYMLTFHMDEYFDIVVQSQGPGVLSSLRGIINNIFEELDNSKSTPSKPLEKSSTNGAANGTIKGKNGVTMHGETNRVDSTAQERIRAQITQFVRFVFSYPGIELASENDKGQLRHEMKICLLAHATQCEDNTRLKSQTSVELFLTPRSSYLKWVRSTAADHLFAPLAFAFITCLHGHSANKSSDLCEDFFPTAEIKYVAQDCVTHLAVICRIWNDYGSLSRDREERNLNTVFFPEFESQAKKKTKAQLQEELAALCNYESKCLQLSLDELLRVAQKTLGRVKGEHMHEVVKLFYNSGDIFNDIYKTRDISTSL